MADNYSQCVVRAAVGQICKSIGFDSISSSALEVLVDFAERHATKLGKKSRRYAEQFGRADPTIDDLEMAFKETDVNVKDMVEFKKSIEPLSLPQVVQEFPVESLHATKLFIPKLDDDGKIVTPAPVVSTPSMSQSTSQIDNNESVENKSTVDSSPLRNTSKTNRVMGGVVNAKFRMRTDLMIEDGQISSLFDQGKGPSPARPPKPLHEVSIPKLRAEPSSKPKIKTGVLKPKPKSAAPVVTPPPEEEEPKEVEVVVETPIKHKPPKKVDKKRKKKAVSQPEGFTDIFGAPLQKPTAKATKLERRLSVTLEDIGDRCPSVASYQPDEPIISGSEASPKIDNSSEATQARMKKVDDAIDSVLASGEKHEKARDAFTFNDLKVPTTSKSVQKSPSKKSKSSGQSRSPSKKGHATDATRNTSQEKSSDGKKEKSKKKSRRTQLLEKFAAAPITDVHSEEAPASVTPQEEERVVSDIETSPVYSSSGADSRPIHDVTQPPLDEIGDDGEDDIVNVDECSDVDILEASSPTPSPKNPFQGYVESGGPPTPTFTHSAVALSPPPLDYLDTHISGGTDDQWGVIPPDPNLHATDPWQEGNSQMIDFGAPQPITDTVVVVKKEKHKKEKKEKKEKKKKKHKEKDKDREGRHKHKREKGHISPVAHEPMEYEEEQAIPRLTLRVPQDMEADYSQSYSELDASYNSLDPEPAPVEDVVPKLVIKPVVNDVTSYLPPQAPPIGSYPETAGFAAHQSLPAATQYVLPQPDEDGKIWICPWCGKVDDGSPMIGCDGCDEWFHWACVGITQQPPEDVEWFCRTCADKDKKKKKKKKKEKR